MTIRIKVASEKDMQAWDNYVFDHSDGIAYQLSAWKNAIERAYKFKNCYLTAKNGSNITGVLPLIYFKIPFNKPFLISLPYCDAGGPLADSPEIEFQLLIEAFKIAKDSHIKNAVIRSCRPFGQIDENQTLNISKVRMMLGLPGNSEDLMNSFKSKLRSQIKKPMRDGLKIQSGTKELLDDFFSILSENMRDLGSPVHSKRWYRQILDEYKDRCRIFVVQLPDQTPAAAGILLFHSKTVSVPWASSLKRYNRFNPNMLLYWGFLEYASSNGFSFFDFGRSTPDEGTFRFKKQWGAKPEPLHWVDFNSLNARIDDSNHKLQNSLNARHDLRNFAEVMIQKMPMPVFKKFSSTTRKYISL